MEFDGLAATAAMESMSGSVVDGEAKALAVVPATLVDQRRNVTVATGVELKIFVQHKEVDRAHVFAIAAV